MSHEFGYKTEFCSNVALCNFALFNQQYSSQRGVTEGFTNDSSSPSKHLPRHASHFSLVQTTQTSLTQLYRKKKIDSVLVRHPPPYLCATRNGKLRSVLPSNYRFSSLVVGIDIRRPSGFTATTTVFTRQLPLLLQIQTVPASALTFSLTVMPS